MNGGRGGWENTIQPITGVREGMYMPPRRRDPFSLLGLYFRGKGPCTRLRGDEEYRSA